MKAPKRVSSGKYIDLAKFTKKDVDIKDINTSLNFLYRFTGHYKTVPPLTVAQHTHLVMLFAEKVFPNEKDVLFDCLLHDFAEAYYGDIATPLKKLFGDSYRDYAAEVDEAVYSKLWIIDKPFDDLIAAKCKVCDLLALDTERRVIWADQTGKKHWPEIPSDTFSLDEKRQMFKRVSRHRMFDLETAYKELLKNS